MVGSEVGKPLYTDKLTRTRERLVYARLMVEVSALGERVLEVPIELPTGAQINLKIVYEMLPEYCEVCKKIGHKKGSCGDAIRNEQQQARQGGGRPMGPTERERSQSIRGRGRTRRGTRERREWRPRQQGANQQQPTNEGEQQRPNEENQGNHEQQQNLNEEGNQGNLDEHQTLNVCREIVLISPIPLAVDYTNAQCLDQEVSTPSPPNLQQNERPKETNGVDKSGGEAAGAESLGPRKRSAHDGGSSLHQGETSKQGSTREVQSIRQTRARAARGGGQ